MHGAEYFHVTSHTRAHVLHERGIEKRASNQSLSAVNVLCALLLRLGVALATRACKCGRGVHACTHVCVRECVP